MTVDSDLLDVARHDPDLCVDDLWLVYFALGGMGTAFELAAVLGGALVALDHDREVLAVALAEYFAERLPDLGASGRGDGGPRT